jgi:hypothetical protein
MSYLSGVGATLVALQEGRLKPPLPILYAVRKPRVSSDL